jgi:hypothetical protein
MSRKQSSPPAVHLPVAKLDRRRRLRKRRVREHGQDTVAATHDRPVLALPTEVWVEGESDRFSVAAAQRLEHLVDNGVHD